MLFDTFVAKRGGVVSEDELVCSSASHPLTLSPTSPHSHLLIVPHLLHIKSLLSRPPGASCSRIPFFTYSIHSFSILALIPKVTGIP